MEKIIDKLAWLYIRDGKLLAVRSKGKDMFYIPGGKREEGESDEQALIREVKEELSVDLLPNTIQYAETFTAQADGKDSGVSVKLTCYFSDFNGGLLPDAEIEELRFIDGSDEAICSLATVITMNWLKSRSLISARNA
ncbi:NUDIX domain-containing protein [Photobacterium sp. SDRW27]|uniref:NUDIX hydrolase n=1 Tax=Photobacterium obscurum TaxID=2829490 RepID=UPI00224449C6|nr:NUDIX domain-containing protein [Photobacterium obscurum]MCW8330141.1 NUDIX domain-containing protein [Photobacterium obscurum]